MTFGLNSWVQFILKQNSSATFKIEFTYFNMSFQDSEKYDVGL